MTKRPLDYATPQRSRRPQQPPLIPRVLAEGVTAISMCLGILNGWCLFKAARVDYGGLLVADLIYGLPSSLLGIGLLREPRWWPDHPRLRVGLQTTHFVCLTVYALLAASYYFG